MEKQRLWWMLLAAAFLFMLVPWAAQADIDPAKVQNLVADDGAAWDYFGESVSLSADGRTALIGAIYGDGVIGDSGSAYVFTQTIDGVWRQQAKLTAEDGASADHFGESVSLSADGRTALIGAYYNITAPGSAYIFIRTADGTWSQTAKLMASDGMPNDWFGLSVSLSADGRTAIIGAPNISASYVFIRTANGAWVQQAKLASVDGAAGDWFGWAVSLSADGSTTLIGAPLNDGYGSNSGSAYIFIRSVGSLWTQQIKLNAPDETADDWFGYSVSLSPDSNTALIGARYGDGNVIDSGSAYIFTSSGSMWNQQAKLTAEDGQTDGQFGISLSLSVDGATALIGAWRDDNMGAAYVFTRAKDASWTQHSKLTASDGVFDDSFGLSVALSANSKTALIGAPRDDNRKGSAYIFGVRNLNAILQELIAVVNALNPTVFKNSNMQKALTNQLNAALALADQGNYPEMLDKLQNGILGKTDGCSVSEEPDKNDWIQDCVSQEQMCPLLEEAIGYLESMM